MHWDKTAREFACLSSVGRVKEYSCWFILSERSEKMRSKNLQLYSLCFSKKYNIFIFQKFFLWLDVLFPYRIDFNSHFFLFDFSAPLLGVKERASESKVGSGGYFFFRTDLLSAEDSQPISVYLFYFEAKNSFSSKCDFRAWGKEWVGLPVVSLRCEWVSVSEDVNKSFEFIDFYDFKLILVLTGTRAN